MWTPLVTFASLHEILRGLFEDIMKLCEGMTSVATGIAGIGALLYISYRVWQALGKAEPLDVFPLLRPFALALCIVLFKPLVLDTMNGILGIVEQGTHKILTGQTFDMNKHQVMKERLKSDDKGFDAAMGKSISDEEFERQLDDLTWSEEDRETMETMYHESMGFGLGALFRSILRYILEFLFDAASLVIDTIRTFYLVVLAILGPIAFAISVFDGFQASLTQWMCKYITVYLWLPVSQLLGAALARLQTLSLLKDMELMETDPFYSFDSSNMVYLVFLAIGICGYFAVPSVASWIVQASGFGSYNKIVSNVGMYVKNKTQQGASWSGQKAWSGISTMITKKGKG